MWDVVAADPGPQEPTGAAFLPRYEIVVRPADGPITVPLAKLGGQPTWLDTPTWPVGAGSGGPMMFIGQMPVPGQSARMAYLFMTDDDTGMAEGYLPDGGDTALLVQPGGRIPTFLSTVEQSTGPTLWRRGKTWWDKIPVELAVDVTPLDTLDEQRLDDAIDAQQAELADIVVEPPASDAPTPSSYVGGRPLFWQPSSIQVARPWLFFFQLGCGDDGYDSTSYTLNFGEGGTGYAFLSPDLLEGRFYWDCL